MAELKRTFLKAKMNKDLDERLIPNGEYRHALNMQIATSEASEVGSAQTIPSNYNNGSIAFDSNNSSQTVGTYTDHENNYIYNFVCDAQNFKSQAITLSNGGVKNIPLGFRSDAITRYKPNSNFSSGKPLNEIVIHDVYEVRIRPKSGAVGSTNSINLSPLFTADSGNTGYTLLGIDFTSIHGVRPGMRVQAVDVLGNDIYGANNKIIVREVQGSLVRTNKIYGHPALWNSNMADQGVYLKFTAPRVLKFRKGNTEENEINNLDANKYQEINDAIKDNIFLSATSGVKSHTPTNSYISSVNVIDDFLLWTDSRNEPKKINIKRCLLGSVQDFEPVVFLTNAGQPIPHTLLVSKVDDKHFITDYLKESHITTLKPNPCNKLVAKEVRESNNTVQDIPLVGKIANSSDAFGQWALYDETNNFYGTNDVIWVRPTISLNEPWSIGTVITVTGLTSSTKVRIQVNDIIDNNSNSNTSYSPNPDGGYYVVSLIDEIPEDYSVENTPAEVWTAFVKGAEDLYNQDFVKFSYRYIYADNEASCLAPFTNSMFIAGDYSYSSKDGFNLGMENNLEEIFISNFYNNNIPRDVSSIELFFKSQKSDNAYSFKTIKAVPNSITNGELQRIRATSHLGVYRLEFEEPSFTIKQKLFGYTLPSDQLTRSFDAVPKKAVAQEIQANRLMYGNYTQDYNLLSQSNKYVKANVSSSVKSLSSSSFSISFNSINTLNASKGTAYNDDGEELVDESTITITDTNLINGIYSSQNIKMSIASDPGDNFSEGLNFSIYKAPVSGTYTLTALASVTGNRATGNFEDVTYYRQPRNVRLAVYSLGFNDATQVIGGATTPIAESPYRTTSTIQNNPYYGVDPITHANGGSIISYYNNYDPETGLRANEIKIPETEVFLQQDECIALFLQSDENQGTAVDNSGNSLSNGNFSLNACNFQITQAPSFVNDLPSLRGRKSIKSNRNYNVGIVYRDFLGRESSVLIDQTEDFNCDKGKASKSNFLEFAVNNDAPAWAETYKYFIKENTSKYENLVLEAAFRTSSNDLATDGDYVYLVFNSIDRNKVKTGDYLIAKKQHNTNVSITNEKARFRVISIIGDASTDEGFQVDGTAVPASVQAEANELEGKFFVKIFNDSDNLIGDENVFASDFVDDAITSSVGSDGSGLNGAVFETEPDTTLDLDLYYEISDAIPVKLTNDLANKYIKNGSSISIRKFGPPTATGSFNPTLPMSSNPTVVGCIGSITDGYDQSQNGNNYAFCIVRLSSPATENVNVILNPDNTSDRIARFSTSEREYVDAYIAKPINIGDYYIYLSPKVHDSNLKIAPGFYNCISFGNGVESDTIRDDFNGTELFKYTATGKQSGVRANTSMYDYKEYTKQSDIIFSEIYNENRNSNRFNEFLIAKNIIKQVNPDYGSIQKLFSRNNDLLTLCEKKCLKILSQKDALFNADGDSQLLATDKVLGQAIPFKGDYGISKNPESFAADEYRCYFVDKNRSVVIRLSGDGITPISSAGMKDWFADHLTYTQAAIGSFDKSKNEYNVTLHEILAPNISKLVYTLSFSEDVDGWTSFKSYIKEAGTTLNNNYYTFKRGTIWSHKIPAQLLYSYKENKYDYNKSLKEFSGLFSTANRFNNFYGTQYLSEIVTIFNDSSDTVKTFRYFSYEGDQAKISQNFSDLDYYNLYNKDGWYCAYLKTDLQDSGEAYFKKKEGKWFSYIKGEKTRHKNNFNVTDPVLGLQSNIDTQESTVQGLGTMLSDVILVSGTLPTVGINVNVNPVFSSSSTEFEAEGLSSSSSSSSSSYSSSSSSSSSSGY